MVPGVRVCLFVTRGVRVVRACFHPRHLLSFRALFCPRNIALSPVSSFLVSVFVFFVFRSLSISPPLSLAPQPGSYSGI